MKAVVLGPDADALAATRVLAAGGVDVTLVAERSPAARFDDVTTNVWAATMLPDGTRLDLTHDIPRTANAIRKLSPRDADQWPRFCDRLHVLAGVLDHLYAAPPPDPLTRERPDFLELARTALRLRKLGAANATELMRLVPMSAADLLDSWFESDALKGVLGAQSVRNLAQGPRAGGTAFNLLHHHVGCAPGVFRRAPADLDAPEGITRIEARARRIEMSDGRAVGVVLDDGRAIAADVVVSALDPKHTLLELVDAACLDPELVRAIRNIRSRGVVAHIDFTVDAAPSFSTLTVAPSLDYLERAYDHSKYGRVSSDPLIDATSVGHTGVHAHVQYVPYALREGEWNDDRRKALAGVVVAKLDALAPGFARSVVAADVLTPVDLEMRYGWPQGQAHHAEIALDQVLWMRPVPALARYRTPVAGLYLCGRAMHPGIEGRAGANAAAVVLRDAKDKKS